MFDHLLQTIPPLAVYALVGLIIGIESMGVPIPGELTLISAALLSAQHIQTKWGVISPWGVAIGAITGAIVGDSIGYLIGRKGGRPLLAWLGRKFPKHFGPDHLNKAEEAFTKWGMWAVFVGRFIALLRILAGPLAGALRMPYPKFLIANASGGIVWAGGTTAVIYALGRVAEGWLHKFSWIGLIVAVVFGLATTAFMRHRATKGKHNSAVTEGVAGE